MSVDFNSTRQSESDDEVEDQERRKEVDEDYVPEDEVAEENVSRNLVLAYSVRKRPYKPLRRYTRSKLLRDFILRHNWKQATKWLRTLIDDISVPHDFLYRVTMIVLEANKPEEMSFSSYFSRTISPLVKSFLTMDVNKREVLLDICTMLCNHNLLDDARQLLEENSRIILCTESSIHSLKGFRSNDTIDTCLTCYKAYLAYLEWRSDLVSSPVADHIEQVREARAHNAINQLRLGVTFSDAANVIQFIFALQDMYQHYKMTAEAYDLWQQVSEKHSNNLFILIGFWKSLGSLDLLPETESKERLHLFEKLRLLDPSHPLILDIIASGELNSVGSEMSFVFVTCLLDFVDYESNSRHTERAWNLLINLIEQMHESDRDRVRSLYLCKYASYWQYTHLKCPRSEAEETFVKLVAYADDDEDVRVSDQ